MSLFECIVVGLPTGQRPWQGCCLWLLNSCHIIPVAFLLCRVTSWTAFAKLLCVPYAVYIAISLACPTSIPLSIAFLKMTPLIARCLNRSCFLRSKYLVRPGAEVHIFRHFHLWDAFLHSGFTLSASYVRLVIFTLIFWLPVPGWPILFHPFASRTSQIYLVHPYSELSQTQLFSSRVLVTNIAVLCSFI